MAVRSSVVELKQAIKTALEARSALADVQVTIGFPNNPKRRWISIARVEREFEVSGMRRPALAFNEDLTVDIVCVSVVPGKKADEAEEDVSALSDEVLDAFASDPKLGIDGTINSARPVSADLDSYAVPEGMAGQVVVRIACKARLNP